MEGLDRRDFIKHASVAVGAGLTGLRGSTAASDKISVAVIGANSRGNEHIAALTELSGVEVAYVCDVDDRVIEKGLKTAAKRQATAPKGLKDFRKALADPSLDAVTIAAQDRPELCENPLSPSVQWIFAKLWPILRWMP